MGQSMPTGPAIPAEDAVETAERARAQRLEKVKQQLQRVRDALEVSGSGQRAGGTQENTRERRCGPAELYERRATCERILFAFFQAEILQRFHEVVEMRGATGDGKGEPRVGMCETIQTRWMTCIQRCVVSHCRLAPQARVLSRFSVRTMGGTAWTC